MISTRLTLKDCRSAMAFGSTKRKRPVDDDAVEVVREVAKDADGAAGGDMMAARKMMPKTVLKVYLC